MSKSLKLNLVDMALRKTVKKDIYNSLNVVVGCKNIFKPWYYQRTKWIVPVKIVLR